MKNLIKSYYLLLFQYLYVIKDFEVSICHKFWIKTYPILFEKSILPFI